MAPESRAAIATIGQAASFPAGNENGQMLRYTPVIDLIRPIGHASNTGDPRLLRTSGDHGSIGHLRAAE
jgi:hypothetical protein